VFFGIFLAAEVSANWHGTKLSGVGCYCRPTTAAAD